MLYLLHGDDDFSSRERLRHLRSQGAFDFNQDSYDGSATPLQTILMTCSTLPFLTEQRLVVVDGLPKKKRGESATPKRKSKKKEDPTASRAGFEQALAEYLPDLPESTILILFVPELLEKGSPLLNAAEKHGKVYTHPAPKGPALEKWLLARARDLQVQLAPDAASLLLSFSGNDLHLLANELQKLATYVGKDGQIQTREVRLLTAQVQEARIFDLTDALAQKNRKVALNILHDLLADGEPPLKVLSTVTSQVRSLLLVKELSQKGLRSAQIASTLGMAPFIVEKAMRQTNQFTVPQLEQTYRNLLDTDASLKRSKLSPELALDLFVMHFGA